LEIHNAALEDSLPKVHESANYVGLMRADGLNLRPGRADTDGLFKKLADVFSLNRTWVNVTDTGHYLSLLSFLFLSFQ
jgi:hypothetical protein